MSSRKIAIMGAMPEEIEPIISKLDHVETIVMGLTRIMKVLIMDKR